MQGFVLVVLRFALVVGLGPRSASGKQGQNTIEEKSDTFSRPSEQVESNGKPEVASGNVRAVGHADEVHVGADGGEGIAGGRDAEEGNDGGRVHAEDALLTPKLASGKGRKQIYSSLIFKLDAISKDKTIWIRDQQSENCRRCLHKITTVTKIYVEAKIRCTTNSPTSQKPNIQNRVNRHVIKHANTRLR